MNKLQLFKLASQYHNPPTWSLWRAFLWEFQKLPLCTTLCRKGFLEEFRRIAVLGRHIAQGVVPLTAQPVQKIPSLRNGFSTDFAIAVNHLNPSQSRIIELFTGRLNPSSFLFLPPQWPYPIHHYVSDQGNDCSLHSITSNFIKYSSFFLLKD